MILTPKFYPNLQPANKDLAPDGVTSVLIAEVFIFVMKQRGVPHFRPVSPVDHLVPMGTIARHFHCPVLSDDSDFLLEDIPGGVVQMRTLLDDFRVSTEDTGER